MNREDGGFTWSLTHNSRFEISKLAVLHASRRTQPDPTNPKKRIALDRPPLCLQGKMVKEVDSYKYLEVHVDSQLRWTIQAQKGVANATKWVMQLRRLTRISTGIGIRLMRRLYITVALLKMTYGLDVWYTPPTKPLGHRRSVGSVGVLRQMGKLQRLASLSIVGGMKSTPTDLLDAHAGLLPIELTLLCYCHRATIRLCTLPPVHPLHPLVRATHQSHNGKHQDPIKAALRIFELDPHKFETVTPDITPPAYFSHIKTTISKTCEDSILTEANDSPDFKIYTDSSGHNGKVGASAVLFRKGECQAIKSLTYHLGDLTRHSIIEAKITGVLLAAWLIHTTPGSAHFSFSIYTDSQTVIRLLTRCFSGSGSILVNAFHTAANTPLKVNWISGHSKVRGNVKADDLASLAAQGQSSPAADLPPLLRKPLPFSADAEKQVYNQEIKAMWTEQWRISPR